MTPARIPKIIESLSPPEVTAHQAVCMSSALSFECTGLSNCSPQTLQEIAEFLDLQNTSHPFQMPQWGHDRALLAFLRVGGRVRWFAQCGVYHPAGRFLRLIRAMVVYRGPVCDDLGLMEIGLQHLIAEGRRRKVAYIDIAPEWVGEFAELARPMLARNGWQFLDNERSSLRLTLTPTAEELLASLRSTTRYKIRRSEAGGVEVTIAKEEVEFREFFRLYEKMATEKQFPAESAEFLLTVFRWLTVDPRCGGFFLAREHGTLKGGILVVRCGARCWYILGATAKDSRFTAGHLLQWRAIQWAKENGCFEYDFGGYREGMSSGPAYFKRGFCDHVVHFLAPHRYVVNQNGRTVVDLTSNLRSKFHRVVSLLKITNHVRLSKSP
jgi:hypothetical protein